MDKLPPTTTRIRSRPVKAKDVAKKVKKAAPKCAVAETVVISSEHASPVAVIPTSSAQPTVQSDRSSKRARASSETDLPDPTRVRFMPTPGFREIPEQAEHATGGSSSEGPPSGPLLGRDAAFVERAEREYPEAPADLFDFITANPISPAGGLPEHVISAMANAARAWSYQLERVSQSDNDVNFLMASMHLAQAAVFQEKCQHVRAAENEVLVGARKTIAVQDSSIANLSKHVQSLEDELGRAKEKLVENQTSLERKLVEAREEGRKAAAEEAAVEKVALEKTLSNARAELKKVTADLAKRDLEHKKRVDELAASIKDLENRLAPAAPVGESSQQDPLVLGDFAYYTCFADVLRELCKEKLPTAHVEKCFKDFVLSHPLPKHLFFEIKDLSTVHKLDLSWWPNPRHLLEPGEDFPSDTDEDEEEEEETQHMAVGAAVEVSDVMPEQVGGDSTGRVPFGADLDPNPGSGAGDREGELEDTDQFFSNDPPAL